ncbi:MAG: zf-HC2 domain-containing protein [Planctomycetota bacterium]|jgi:anti-sigma factor RsiW
MDCGKARRMIHGRLDTALSGVEEAALTEHLDSCEPCRRYGEVFREMKDRLVSIGAAAVRYVGERPVERFLREGLSSNVSPVFGLGSKPRFVYAAAAAVLLAFAIFAGMAILVPSPTLADSTLEQHRLRMSGRLVLDSHADCCKDLEEWFQAEVEHPVNVPEISIEGIEVEGGKLYRHPTGNELLYAAYRLEGKPVSVFVCSGPNIEVPAGRRCKCGSNEGVITEGEDYTMITWRAGECINVLVTSFGPEKTERIFAAIR